MVPVGLPASASPLQASFKRAPDPKKDVKLKSMSSESEAQGLDFPRKIITWLVGSIETPLGVQKGNSRTPVGHSKHPQTHTKQQGSPLLRSLFWGTRSNLIQLRNPIHITSVKSSL